MLRPVSDALVPIVTALAGLVSGIVAASWRTGLGLAARYDADIRDKRLAAYAKLWSSLKGLDRRARPLSMTLGDALELLEQLTDWYHETGGLLMSRATQRKFADLQQLLVEATSTKAAAETELSTAMLSQLIAAVSALRTSTTQDILSRRGPLLGARVL